jgi:hypothetical protein
MPHNPFSRLDRLASKWCQLVLFQLFRSAFGSLQKETIGFVLFGYCSSADVMLAEGKWGRERGT